MSQTDEQGRRWQFEANLLSSGRDQVEVFCQSWRYRNLYPSGDNPAIVLRAYQELEVQRTIAGDTWSDRRIRRRFRRLIARCCRQDALARQRKVRYRLPDPRAQHLPAPPSPPVARAVLQLDPDARESVRAIVMGQHETLSAGQTRLSKVFFRISQAMDEFRAHLVNEAFAHPDQISRIHPQQLRHTESIYPARLGHPIASFLFVRLPARALAALLTVMMVLYLVAYAYLNWAVFDNGRTVAWILSDRISALIDGEMKFEEVRFGPTLAVDILTGRPHALDIRGLTVWEPPNAEGARHLTAAAEHITAELNVLEIIPINRLGIPRLLAFPWLLHFASVESHGDFFVEAREIPGDPDGTVGLVAAFHVEKVVELPEGTKTLGIEIDAMTIRNPRVRLRFEEQSDWAVELDAALIEGALRFDGRPQGTEVPALIPLRWSSRATSVNGEIRALGYRVPVRELDIASLANGMDATVLGDMSINASGEIAGGNSKLRGTLQDLSDRARPVAVNAALASNELGPLISWFVAEVLEQAPSARPMFDGTGARGRVQVRGPLTDPELTLEAEGLAANLFEDDAWSVQDIDVRLSLAQQQVAPSWGRLWREFGPGGELPIRWRVTFDVLRGAALGGYLRLQGTGADDHIILPSNPGDPLLAALDFDALEVDPAMIFYDVDDVQDLLSGYASGRVKVRNLVLAPSERGDLEFARTQLKLSDVRIVRDHGPADDGLPRRFRMDTQLRMDAVDGVDLRGLNLALAGGRISGNVGLTADYERFKPSELSIAIEEGGAFFDAFELPTYVRSLAGALAFQGPMHRLSGPMKPMTLRGLQLGNLSLSESMTATAGFERGVLRFRARDAQILGGHGPLEIDLHPFDARGIADTPKVRLYADLDEMDRENLLDAGINARGAQLALMVDDGQGAPVSIDDVQARGAAFASTLQTETLDFRNAELRFKFLKNGLELDSLRLEHHAAISPLFNGSRAVPYGMLTGRGRVDFSSNTPTVDLELEADDLPISGFSNLAFPEMAIRGNLSTTAGPLKITGRFDRPTVDGTVAVDTLSAVGYPLGGGTLEIQTLPRARADSPPPSQTLKSSASHGLLLSGRFQSPRAAGMPGDLPLRWSSEVVVGFPRALNDDGLDATIHAEAAVIPTATILPSPDQAKLRSLIEAELNDATARSTYCGAKTATLDACDSTEGSGLAPIAIRVASAWAHPRNPNIEGAEATRAAQSAEERAACDRRRSMCAERPLVATYDDELLVLDEPWSIHTGGAEGSSLRVDGSLDLRADEDADARRCAPDSANTGNKAPLGRGRATVLGQLDLSGLSPELEGFGIDGASGTVELGLALTGSIDHPTLTGSVQPSKLSSIAFSIDGAAFGIDTGETGVTTRIPIRLSDLKVALGERDVDASISLRMFDEALTVQAQGPFLTQCPGEYAVTVSGDLAGRTLALAAPDVVRGGAGRVSIDNLQVTGRIGASNATPIETMSGRLHLDERASLSLSTPLDQIDMTQGDIDITMCRVSGDGVCVPSTSPGATPDAAAAVRLSIGGRGAADATRAPAQALSMTVGGQGELRLWGEVRLARDLSSILGATLRTSLDQIPLVFMDNGGIPELEMSLSTPNLTARLDKFGASAVEGELYLERSRWLRDANVRASLISFEDPIPAPPSQLPSLVADADLNVTVRTNAPFRTDINVLKGVEARGEVNVSGSVRSPLLSGTVIFERGEIDIPILGEPYRIERGEINVEDDLSMSEVDILAVGLEPKKIDNQLKTVSLLVQGPLNAITWSCSTAGDTSGQLSTTRGCLDFVVFDAGNPELARADVRRAGGGSLVYARPLTLIGNLTQITFNDLLEDEAPTWEARLPIVRARVTQLGVEARLDTRPEWLDLGWGQFSFGFNYLRGFPGGLLRNSRRFYGRLSLFGNTGIEFRTGRRNYSQRVLILDPRDYAALEFVQSWEIPTLR